jgi:hypothetical protein
MLLELVNSQGENIEVKLAETEKSTNVIGIYSNHFYLSTIRIQEVLVYSREEISSGSLICSTSSIKGMAKVQEDQEVHNYTIGKVLQSQLFRENIYKCLCKLYI